MGLLYPAPTSRSAIGTDAKVGGMVFGGVAGKEKGDCPPERCVERYSSALVSPCDPGADGCRSWRHPHEGDNHFVEAQSAVCHEHVTAQPPTPHASDRNLRNDVRTDQPISSTPPTRSKPRT